MSDFGDVEIAARTDRHRRIDGNDIHRFEARHETRIASDGSVSLGGLTTLRGAKARIMRLAQVSGWWYIREYTQTGLHARASHEWRVIGRVFVPGRRPADYSA